MQSTQQQQQTLVKISQNLVITDLLDLLNGKLLALRIPSYYHHEQAEKISEQLIEQDTLERYHRAPDVGVQRTGITFFETNGNLEMLERYYQQAPACNKNIRYTCSPYLSPIDKLRLDLGDIWLAGACIETVHHRTMLAGIGRVFEDDFELPPHQDILARDVLETAIFPTYPFSNLVTQLSANIYLRTPKFGGELEIWNVKPSTLKQPEIHDKQYQYEGIIDRRILPPADSVIRPQIGELILFDSTRVHAVRASQNGPRVSMSMFIGYRDRQEPLTYWS
ncbi:MAG: 2OG-Fe(II) oxygenase [Rivularia sp. (in: cyanobacteria)]